MNLIRSDWSWSREQIVTNRNDILMLEHTMESIGHYYQLSTCCPSYNCLHRTKSMLLYKLTVITIVNIHTPTQAHKVIALAGSKQGSKSGSKELREEL